MPSRLSLRQTNQRFEALATFKRPRSTVARWTPAADALADGANDGEVGIVESGSRDVDERGGHGEWTDEVDARGGDDGLIVERRTLAAPPPSSQQHGNLVRGVRLVQEGRREGWRRVPLMKKEQRLPEMRLSRELMPQCCWEKRRRRPQQCLAKTAADEAKDING